MDVPRRQASKAAYGQQMSPCRVWFMWPRILIDEREKTNCANQKPAHSETIYSNVYLDFAPFFQTFSKTLAPKMSTLWRNTWSCCLLKPLSGLHRNFLCLLCELKGFHDAADINEYPERMSFRYSLEPSMRVSRIITVSFYHAAILLMKLCPFHRGMNIALFRIRFWNLKVKMPKGT